MRYAITRHSLVEYDLENIQDYIAPFAGAGSAARVLREVNATIRKLRDFPHIGTVRNDIVSGLRALPAAEKAVICFTVNEEMHNVKIVCVAYAGQDWHTIVKSRDRNERSS